ncbi:hypothetical protein D1872_239370 [compost metagenome]
MGRVFGDRHPADSGRVDLAGGTGFYGVCPPNSGTGAGACIVLRPAVGAQFHFVRQSGGHNRRFPDLWDQYGHFGFARVADSAGDLRQYPASPFFYPAADRDGGHAGRRRRHYEGGAG